MAQESGPRIARIAGRKRKSIRIQVEDNGNKESMAHLEKLTHDPDTDVAQEAIRALKNLQARLSAG